MKIIRINESQFINLELVDYILIENDGIRIFFQSDNSSIRLINDDAECFKAYLEKISHIL